MTPMKDADAAMVEESPCATTVLEITPPLTSPPPIVMPEVEPEIPEPEEPMPTEPLVEQPLPTEPLVEQAMPTEPVVERPVETAGEEEEKVDPPKSVQDELDALEHPPHHMLDPLLTRVNQDKALGKVPGKGRKPKAQVEDQKGPKTGKGKKGKGNKGKGKGKGKKGKNASPKKAVPKTKAAPKRKCRTSKVLDMDAAEGANFSLLKETPELMGSEDDVM